MLGFLFRQSSTSNEMQKILQFGDVAGKHLFFRLPTHIGLSLFKREVGRVAKSWQFCLFSWWEGQQKGLARQHKVLGLSSSHKTSSTLYEFLCQEKSLQLAGCFLCTYHCVGFLRFLLLAHRGTAAGGRTGVGWGTGRAGSWAMGPLQGAVGGGGCPGQRRLHLSHRGHGGTGGSCLCE